MTTEALAPPVTNADLKAIRAYEVFERLRQGESLPEIAEDLGLCRQSAQAYVKELAAYARASSKELAATTFLTADLRLNDLYKKSYSVASDDLSEHDIRLKAIATCLAIQTKINDLHQVGRGTQVPASAWVNIEDMTEAEVLLAAKRIGIPVPKEIAMVAGVVSKEDRYPGKELA